MAQRSALMSGVLALAGWAGAQAATLPLQGGVNRAAPVVLHCVSATGLAVACGTSAAPIVVGAAGGLLTSRTITVPAQTSVQLFPSNGQRRYLAIQVPAGTGIWLNVMGGTASAGGSDCMNLQAGALYESGSFVNTGAITVFSPVATTISAWEG
jgi:hypothetical protein